VTTRMPDSAFDFGQFNAALWVDQRYGRCKVAGLSAQDVRLMAAAADLMYSVDEFYGQAAAAARGRLDRLFGFPVRESPDAGTRVKTRVRYLRAMPEDSRAVYDRAAERICQRYEPLREACARIWMPAYTALDQLATEAT
jgi:hypothetical protein